VWVRYEAIFGNLLKVANVITFKSTLNFLLLATRAVKEKFLGDYKRKDKAGEVGSSKKKMRLFQEEKF